MTKTMAGVRAVQAGPASSFRETVPAYWRGRARASRFLAAQEVQNGNRQAAEDLEQLANMYEAQADNLEARAAPERSI